jgi:hypothetical protein
MRRIVLTLPFVLLSLAFAPAPFAKPQRSPRETEQAKRDRVLHECRRRLDELGVTWRLDRQSVFFNVRHPNGGGMGGSWGVRAGDVAGTLRRVIVRVEQYLGLAPGLKR